MLYQNGTQKKKLKCHVIYKNGMSPVTTAIKSYVGKID